VPLDKYRQKRQFQGTPEPTGGDETAIGPLRFVVQKHRASRLHYDFRLEVGGVLKSWAVPKGPSLDPGEKRLALMVEDHPIAYADFEGVIPEGNYGAGTVMVWDHGRYCARSSADRAESERLVEQGLAAGDLKIILDGQKLKGEFAVVKLKSKGKKGDENAWLLIKKHDAFATSDDVTKLDLSSVSHRSMDEIARGPGAAWGPQAQGGRGARIELGDAPAAAMPHDVRPMLATAIDRPFDRPGWLFEVKWDGYRAIAEVDRGKVRLYSRNQVGLESKFPPIVKTLASLGHDAVLDGEIVVLDAAGRADFERLQNYARSSGTLVYFVFDILFLDGHDLRTLPLGRRKQILKQIVGSQGNVRFCEHVDEAGVAFYRAVCEHGLEGFVAKDATSRYAAGKRGKSWLKLKAVSQQEAVIGGYTEQRGDPRGFGSLMLGVYEGDELRYIGQAGTGFTTKSADELRRRLDAIEIPTCPFRSKPKPDAPVHWVKPELVCQVKFQNWTSEGVLRQPVFLGMRDDKPAREVHHEQPVAPPRPDRPDPSDQSDGSDQADQSDVGLGVGVRGPRAQLKEQRIAIGGNVLKLTNLTKVLWPVEGYTKADLIDYYRTVAPVILPYLRDRPQSLHRHPDGIGNEGFYQKDVRDPPPWVQTVHLRSRATERPINYLLCQDEATLVYLANLACIELNPWFSRVDALDRPDFLVVDLDTDVAPFAMMVETALVVRKTLDDAGATGVCKTSGKKGLHIYVPLGARYDYDQAVQFAELLARMVHAQLPQTTSMERSPEKRRGLVYPDYLQNRRGQTIAAPYSVRPFPGATVSTPLRWQEVKRGLDPAAFTIRTVPPRLDKLGDLWAPVLGPGVDILGCIERLARVTMPRRTKG